jgi:hypothetical protein
MLPGEIPGVSVLDWLRESGRFRGVIAVSNGVWMG